MSVSPDRWAVTTATVGRVTPVSPSRGALRPLGLDEVRIEGGFWAERQHLNAKTILRHIETWVEKMGWLANFDNAVAGHLPAARRGREFSDSDAYKLLEAMAWEVGRSGDQEIDERLDRLVARIAPAQEPDGYLNTMYGRPGQPPRYSDLQWGHELYCYGHLIQAAVARLRTHREDTLVTVARRAADHVCLTFGRDGIQAICGHPGIEIALVELARSTGEQKYLDQAKLFVERRGYGVLGDIELGRTYYQDDVPVRAASVLAGHAVRALYLAAGAVDVAVETGDDELLHAVRHQVTAALGRRTYLTGGMGARHDGESFGEDYELPPDRAYSETCAGVASVMVNHRLLLATGSVEHADAVERTLYNVVAASPAEDGQAFFYTNTLHQRTPGAAPAEDQASPRAYSSQRAPWFHVSCCPPNVARTFASLACYFATANADGVQLQQYAPATVQTLLADGQQVRLQIATQYPHDGRITVTILSDADAPWTLSCRIPAWATTGATLTVTGEPARPVEPGYAPVTRAFAAGDVVELSLPVRARWTWPDPRIDAIRGQVAVERGPLVFCMESTDPGTTVNHVRVAVDDAPIERDGRVQVITLREDLSSVAWPYSGQQPTGPVGQTTVVPLIPYYAWANQGPSTMRVWLPTTVDAEQASGSTAAGEERHHHV